MIDTIDKYKALLDDFAGHHNGDYLLYQLSDSWRCVALSVHSNTDTSTDYAPVPPVSEARMEALQMLAEKGEGLFPIAMADIKLLKSGFSACIATTRLVDYVALLFIKGSMQSFASNLGIGKLLQFSREIYFSFDIEGKGLDYISDSVLDVLGYVKQDLLGKSFEQLVEYVHPEDRAGIEQSISFEKEYDDDTPVSIQFRFIHKLGIYLYFQLNAILDFEDGKPVKVFCSLRDISDAKEAEENVMQSTVKIQALEEELRKTNAELASDSRKDYAIEPGATASGLTDDVEIFQQLAENTNDIFMLRDDKRILYINNQFEKIWGRSKEDLIKDPYQVSNWIYPDDVPNIEVWVNLENLTRDTPFVEQFRIVKPDGEVRWLWSRSFPVYNKKGVAYRLVSITTDITEQKDFEEALMMAKEKAQENDMLKSTFLANISHEIRTPMNGIVGFSELIARNDLDANTRKNYVTIMKKSSEQLIRIIDDIIDFAKLEANQIRVASETFDVNRLIDQLFVFFESKIEQSDSASLTLLVSKALPDEESELMSDEHRIRQVISYLIDNSIKYTSEGFIEFGYTLQGDKVEFFVKDSGIGISEEKKEVIFERFRQADEGHTRKYGGTGLGLPIAQGLINLLGGDIRFESEEDKGTTFFFTIPHKVEKAKEAESTLSDWIDEKYNWKDKLILVAEDDELNFEYMKIILESSQAKVIRAKDGSQAVKICSNLNFDVILMDIRLPILNGIQATQQLREMGVKTPIIAQTAFAMDDDEHKCLSAGCDRYITKPISKDKLFSTIEELMDNS